jgi:hypothetical protein
MLWLQLRAVALALLFSIATLNAALADQPPIIADTDAAAHVGQVATVEGLVANVFVSSKGICFLDFEGAYPNEVFSGVVFSSSAARFGNLTTYRGKRVQITGQIRLYKGKPEIILESPGQLQLAP